MLFRGKLLVELAKKSHKVLDEDKNIPLEPMPSTSTPLDESDKDMDFSDSSSDNYLPPEQISRSSSSESDEKSPDKERDCLKRWKEKKICKWKRNINKEKRSQGLPYKTAGKEKPPKIQKPIDCSKCKFKCTETFTECMRSKMCREYWKLDYNRQKDFLINMVSESAVKRQTTSTVVKKKKFSRTYFFFNSSEKKQVCKNFFLKTLCISHGPVDSAMSGRSELGTFIKPDQRGNRTPSNKTPKKVLDSIKAHIESFPVTESHYCRKSSKKKYLDEKLSIVKMHSLFLEKCEKESMAPVSEITYRRYFCQNYNLSFFKPKKDNCLTCSTYKKTKENEELYKAHISRRDEANAAKNEDKKRANTDKTFVSATFDLQSVLQIPSSDVAPMYYSRKLCAYNLTVYEAALPNKAHCFTWTEINGQRGSSEIGSALLKWFSSIPSSVKEVSLFSDTCSGQNRNQYIAAFFLFVVQNTHLDAVQHNFLESGHSHMEVDSMHSAIESAKKFVEVFTLHDWINIFKMARSKRGKKQAPPYEVTELLYGDFKNLKEMAKKMVKNRCIDEDGNRVQWLKLKCMRYEKMQPGIIKFKYNYGEQFKTLKVTASRQLRENNIQDTLSSLYTKEIPISAAKKKDLVKLCTTGAIPEIYHSWYNSLPSTAKTDHQQEAAEDSETESDFDD